MKTSRLKELHRLNDAYISAQMLVHELMVSDLAAAEPNFETMLKDAKKKLEDAKAAFGKKEQIEFEELSKAQPHYAKTSTIISALHILARDIQSDDGVANAALTEAAIRMEEMLKLIDDARGVLELWSYPGGKFDINWINKWTDGADKCGSEKN